MITLTRPDTLLRRINRVLSQGQRLHKSRSDCRVFYSRQQMPCSIRVPLGRFYLVDKRGHITPQIDIETLARQLGVLKALMTGATGNKEWLARLIRDTRRLERLERQRAGSLNDLDPIFDDDDENSEDSDDEITA